MNAFYEHHKDNILFGYRASIRLYQRISDDLEALLTAIGLKIAA